MKNFLSSSVGLKKPIGKLAVFAHIFRCELLVFGRVNARRQSNEM